MENPFDEIDKLQAQLTAAREEVDLWREKYKAICQVADGTAKPGLLDEHLETKKIPIGEQALGDG